MNGDPAYRADPVKELGLLPRAVSPPLPRFLRAGAPAGYMKIEHNVNYSRWLCSTKWRSERAGSRPAEASRRFGSEPNPRPSTGSSGSAPHTLTLYLDLLAGSPKLSCFVAIVPAHGG